MEKRIAGLVLGLALAWLPISASAQNVMLYYMTGSNLLGLCQQNESSCLAYVVGAVDSAIWVTANMAGSMQICIPPTVDGMQLMRMGLKAVQDSPGTQHLSAADPIVAAVMRAFPCR